MTTNTFERTTLCISHTTLYFRLPACCLSKIVERWVKKCILNSLLIKLNFCNYYFSNSLFSHRLPLCLSLTLDLNECRLYPLRHLV